MTKKQKATLDDINDRSTMTATTLQQPNGKIRIQWFELACDDYETAEIVTMTKRGLIHKNGRLQITSSDRA